MPSSDKVSTGKPKTAGAVYRAPAGTTAPTDASTELAAAFKELGFVSDDGVSNSNSGDSTDVYAWGGTPVLATQSEKTDEWKLTLIESLNAEVLKTVYGDGNVTVDESGKKITVKAGAAQLASSVYVIDMLLKGGALKRVVIPVGSLSDVGEIVYKDDEPIGYEITIKGADDGTGYTHYEYIQLPSA